MTIQSHVEDAEKALRSALVLALTEKNDAELSQLFEALNNVKSILNNYPLTFKTNYKFSLTSDYLPDGATKYNFTGLDEIPYGDLDRFPGPSVTSINRNSPDVLSFG